MIGPDMFGFRGWQHTFWQPAHTILLALREEAQAQGMNRTMDNLSGSVQPDRVTCSVLLARERPEGAPDLRI